MKRVGIAALVMMSLTIISTFLWLGEAQRFVFPLPQCTPEKLAKGEDCQTGQHQFWSSFRGNVMKIVADGDPVLMNAYIARNPECDELRPYPLPGERARGYWDVPAISLKGNGHAAFLSGLYLNGAGGSPCIYMKPNP